MDVHKPDVRQNDPNSESGIAAAEEHIKAVSILESNSGPAGYFCISIITRGVVTTNQVRPVPQGRMT